MRDDDITEHGERHEGATSLVQIATERVGVVRTILTGPGQDLAMRRIVATVERASFARILRSRDAD